MPNHPLYKELEKSWQPKNSSYETEIDLFYKQCVNILSETISKVILV
jgi:hypothetical protein